MEEVKLCKMCRGSIGFNGNCSNCCLSEKAGEVLAALDLLERYTLTRSQVNALEQVLRKQQIRLAGR